MLSLCFLLCNAFFRSHRKINWLLIRQNVKSPIILLCWMFTGKVDVGFKFDGGHCRFTSLPYCVWRGRGVGRGSKFTLPIKILKRHACLGEHYLSLDTCSLLHGIKWFIQIDIIERPFSCTSRTQADREKISHTHFWFKIVNKCTTTVFYNINVVPRQFSKQYIHFVTSWCSLT